MRNRDSGRAPRARRTRVLMGVTWVTSRTVRPAWAAISLSRVMAIRRAVAAKLSPPPVGSAFGSASQAFMSSG